MKVLFPWALAALLSAFALQSHAIVVGYSAYLVFEDGSISQPVGETEEECNERVAEIIAMEEARGNPLDEDRSIPSCRPIDERLPELPPILIKDIPLGPVCRSCPLLGPDTFHLFYPEQELIIKDLYYQFGIDKYNNDLIMLQKMYDLKGFEQEVFKLNAMKQ